MTLIRTILITVVLSLVALAQQPRDLTAAGDGTVSKEGPRRDSKAEIIIAKDDMKDISLATAEATIARQQVALLEKDLKDISLRLQQARQQAEEVEAKRKEIVKEKFTKAGVPEADLENWSGTTNDKGQLVLKRTEPKSTKPTK